MDDKQLVGIRAASYVESGMVVGLGTGSTANHFLHELGRRVREERLDVKVVASSFPTAFLAAELGLPLLGIDQVARLDLYADGADEVTPARDLLKGRGFDLVKEKILAQASERFVVFVDSSKLVDRLGTRFPIPVEVLPFAVRTVQRRLEGLGGRATVRLTPQKDAVVITAQGNLVLDTVFDPSVDVVSLAGPLRSIAGVAEHGIFPGPGLVSAVLVAEGGVVTER
ncbi:MAG TPA: ribose-5-phosphate isomerase RpiA [Polyangia bacterium]|nr:ribose-5-phosphate isomerase RpiA [Polyangia bacterium]